MQKDSYHIPQETRIGHVHLKVSDLQRSLDFYCGLLGFKLTQKYGDQAAFVSAGGYHHHIGLNTWQSQNFPPANRDGVGLYHLAILYPTQKDLANIYKRLHLHGKLKIGASDHGVSQAIYIRDPDDNGVELYWDRPQEEWPKTSEGKLAMFTKPLRLKELLELAD